MRVVISGAIFVALFVCAHRPASAMMEFCPASVEYDTVGQPRPAQSALYGFALTALGPRTITSAKLAIYADSEWYTVDLPAMTLSKHDRRYASLTVSFTRHDYVSPVFYVRFAKPLEKPVAWVYSAADQDDGPFGWQPQGNVLCDPPAILSTEQLKPVSGSSGVFPYYGEPLDADPLSNAPSPQSLIISAVESKPLETTNCAEPFRAVDMTVKAHPVFPDRVYPTLPITTTIQAAIDSAGKLRDAWVVAPSGVTAYDDAVLNTVKQSTYAGARAFCRAVPGMFFFRMSWKFARG